MYLFLTVILCAALYFGVVWPLWFFATTNSRLYTTLVIIAAVVFLGFLLVRSFIKRFQAAGSAEHRRKFLIRQLFTFLSVIIMAASLTFAVLLVLSEHRLIALAVLIAGVALSVILHKIKVRFSDV